MTIATLKRENARRGVLELTRRPFAFHPRWAWVRRYIAELNAAASMDRPRDQSYVSIPAPLWRRLYEYHQGAMP